MLVQECIFLVSVIAQCSNLNLLKQYFFIGQLVIHEVKVKLLYACVLSELLRVTTGRSWTLKGVHRFTCSCCCHARAIGTVSSARQAFYHGKSVLAKSPISCSKFRHFESARHDI